MTNRSDEHNDEAKPSHTPLGNEALEFVAQRFRALSDPKRLRILNVLFDGELTVQEIADAAELKQPTASKHLAVLRQHRIVARQKDGPFARYRIVDPSIHDLCSIVCTSLASQFEAARRQLATD